MIFNRVRHVPAVAAALYVVLGMHASAEAASHPPSPLHSGHCVTSVAFGESTVSESGLAFRATVSVACPPGVAFSAALRSANACRLQSAGGSLRYELFADESLQSAVVSCEHPVEPLRGTGRQMFVVYGRISGQPPGSGRFTDELLATVTT